MSRDFHKLDRRKFLKTTAAGLGAATIGPAVVHGQEPSAGGPKVDEKDLIWRSRSPEMEYRRLGRTNYMVSRIVAGNHDDDGLRRRMIERGMNYLDTGRQYGEHEVKLKPFLKDHRDKVWVTSKASDVAGWRRIDEEVDRHYRSAMQSFLGESEGHLLALHKKAIEKEKATGERPDLRPASRRMAALYTRLLDESLGRMGIDCVDAYFVHGVEIPWIWQCTELWDAYEKAHQAGKVRHFGFSTHNHQKEVLAATVEANAKGPWKIDLIMPGVNPESFDKLRPELEALKKQDVGIIAMKTSGIKGRPVDGREKKFEALMGGREYNEWERAKLWMLHLTNDTIDACIARMENNRQMAQDLALPGVKLSAAAERELRAIVKLEMAGACHLCGNCETNCPEHIAVTDMVRYHAYVHQYNDKALARELYSMAGYDPARVCSNCGKCAEACDSGVKITQILHQLSVQMA